MTDERPKPIPPRPEDLHKYDYVNEIYIRKDEYPLTEEEIEEMYRRMGNVVSFTRRPSSSPSSPGDQSPPG